ncbi:unnamed protein product [Thlaspi arvense]|uniref:non-specific serine/threonine protein kinase n=1 Tax=Thlaspi arvense TaxID=13288 RepID=A0AAU9SPS3_THLAR|nr:unnamed protein product [Thlaspi arvense]
MHFFSFPFTLLSTCFGNEEAFFSNHFWIQHIVCWKGSDPCGTNWVGVTCSNDRVISISLGNLNLEGKLSADVSALSKLQILDLTSNLKLSGPLPSNIGNLKKLTTLNLMACGFSGQIPETIGSLEALTTLSLNSNKFSGTIPASIGRLSKLFWFDIADNQIEGKLPVSNGTSSPGLDMLFETQHFHFGNNKLSGDIPEKLFTSNMTLLHVLFDGNQLTGKIPDSISLVKTLTVLRLDRNKLTGDIPASLNNLTDLQELYLANNRFNGSLPNLTSLSSLYTLRMEGIQLEGPIPISLFSSILLQTVVLKRNQLNATLDFGTNYSNQLEFVDLQNNEISTYKLATSKGIQVMYGKEPNPVCRCVYPVTGILIFRSPSFSGFSNNTNFIMLQQGIAEFFKKLSYQVDYVAIRNIRETIPDHQLLIDLLVFPLDKEIFDGTGMNSVISAFSTHAYDPPGIFGSYIFKADQYRPFSGGSTSANTAIIIGAAVGAAVLLLLLAVAEIYALRQKKRAERASGQNNPFAKWNKSKSSIDAPQLIGAKAFTFEELRKCTDNFSKANDVGGGGYGQVYKGTLPSRQLIAIKRAQQGSSQGELEFKTEIELISRVHHKNVVRLLGFCFDRNEQMLVYEYIPNGSLTDSLSYWTRRLRMALGSGKGLAYLHKLADPPIIHRDIKSNNILLDESLAAKVADFGLSKLVGDPEKIHVTTQVKGTMGYLDPEYYMTNQLTEKSDVYGFGVVMLELLTGKSPIQGGKYVVREVKSKMDKSRNLYDLQELLDTTIIASSGNLNGFEKYVDLSMRCVEEEGVKRPSMGEVVKEIENIMQLAGLNPNMDSATTSRTYEEASKGSGDPYGKEPQ